MSSSELKQLFHSPEDLSDNELDVLRVKLQNMRRIPKFAAGFGLFGAAAAEPIFMRRQPRALSLLLGTGIGYSIGGMGASSISSNVLKRDFDYDIILAQEKRQLRRTMNLAGYNQDHISPTKAHGVRPAYNKPY